MTSSRYRKFLIVAAALASFGGLTGAARAAQCGNNSAGFEAWKTQFADEAQAHGVGAAGISALASTNYSSATIGADRGQHGFHVSLDQFLARRSGPTIVAQGRRLKRSEAAMFSSIEQRYGVPPGPLLAIWGMETGFGHIRGNQNVLSAVATLAYDCRRSAYFTDQLYAALELIDRGFFGQHPRLDARRGRPHPVPAAQHPELRDGRQSRQCVDRALVDGKFPQGSWMQAGAGYQPGQPNFRPSRRGTRPPSTSKRSP